MSASAWKRFGKHERPGREDLLKDLVLFPNAILVAGCQRSGGTMLARAITQHPDVEKFGWSRDAELDAAQLLSGSPNSSFERQNELRYCFQTTYANERAVEYSQHAESIYLIWLIRNPFSVVYSMVHNWKRFALNEVFLGCGVQLLPEKQSLRLRRFGVLGVPPIDRACYAYLGKLEQARQLINTLPADRFATLEYEELVSNKPVMLNRIFEFTKLTAVESDAGAEISTRSLNKAAKLKLSSRATVDRLCSDAYEEFRKKHITLSAR